MTITRRAFAAGGLLGLGPLSACTRAPRFLSYSGPEVTQLYIDKSDRRLFLLNGNEVLRAYSFDLGRQPVGDKRVQGDARTPEGLYYIDRRNPDSQFHLSLGISYPNAEDRAQAARLGQSPGGDIFIHGTPFMMLFRQDWTWGCIAVTNNEIEEIYSMVQIGTPVLIVP